MTTETPTPGPTAAAERIFKATKAALTAQAQAAVGDAEPVVAAAAFWPNGVTKSTMEDGTVGGKKMGAIFGPNLGAMAALAGSFVGRGSESDFAMAKPLLGAVTAAHIFIIEPACGSEPARLYSTFDRATTRVHIKRRGMSRVVILDDDAAGNHLRLHASVAPYMARSGPQKLVMAELTRTAA